MKPTNALPERIPALRAALLVHYDRAARDLPWRRDTDPYRVLISEVMLQQTRVETVIGYYDRWLERFPSVEVLAGASEDEVLKAWEGLGYYRRARNLHRAAQVVRERHAGELPSDMAQLRALPGVGEYTSGAVASIAFGTAVPAVDGNVRRVLARLYDEPDPTVSWLRERAGELVDPDRPGDWNQALMELGATICTPKAPRCAECPWRPECAAHTAGTQLERPRPKERRPVPTRRFTVLVAHADGRILLTRRATDGLLGGMWSFPEEARRSNGSEDRSPSDVRHTTKGSADTGDALGLADRLGLHAIGTPQRLPDCEHRFTHLSATYEPWALEVRHRVPDVGSWAWVDPADPGERALPKAQRTILDSWIAVQSGAAAS